MAREVSQEVERALADKRTRVRGWTGLDVMRDLIVGDADERLDRFLDVQQSTDPSVIDAYLTDREGNVVVSTAAATVPATASGMGRSAAPHPLVLEVQAPIEDAEDPARRIGSLVVHFDVRRELADTVARLHAEFAAMKLRVGVFVLDAQRAVLARELRRPRRRHNPGFRRLPELRDLARAEVPAFVVVPGLRSVLGYAPIRSQTVAAHAVVMQPLHDARVEVRSIRSSLLVWLAVVLTLALAVARVLAIRMTRPLRALTQATRELAVSGTLHEPIPVRTHDEIGELTESFNAAASGLRQAQDEVIAASKLVFVGEIAAGMAHEVRTPLGIMRGSAQLLERSLTAPSAEQRDLLDMLVGEVDRLSGLVTGLGELARPREPSMRATPLSALLARAIRFVEHRAQAEGIALRFESTDDQGVAMCDGEEIYRVALNLLVNAIQALEAGGRIDVRIVRPRPGVVGFEVQDDGPGIPAQRRARIFDPFVSFREGGTGLGLALVERVLRGHGGQVSVASAAGGGSIFQVTLPAAEVAA
jgi:signal transduction histidine kinase